MKGICVVGYGYWGPKLVRNFLAVAAGRPVAVCDDHRARREPASGACVDGALRTRFVA
jgi:hypothetical protein